MSGYSERDFVELFPDVQNFHEYDSVTYDTFRAWDVLAAKCSCGHFGVINRALLVNKYSDHYLISLQPKLKCVSCKQRGTSKFWVGRLPR
jgi:hypothetical protein